MQSAIYMHIVLIPTHMSHHNTQVVYLYKGSRKYQAIYGLSQSCTSCNYNYTGKQTQVLGD